MGLVFTRPIYKDGSWLGGTPIIDAKMLTENFQVLYESYNAQIHGSNLAVAGNIGQIDEDRIQWHEFIGDYLGTFGRGHTHDGVDSETLDIDAITSSTTNLASFGSWQFPADGATQIMLYGSAEIIPGAYLPSGDDFTITFDVPHDPLWWGYYNAAAGQGYMSYGRPFVQIRCGDTNLDNKINCVSCALAISPTDPGWLYLSCTIEMDTNTIRGSHESIFIDWMIAALTYRDPA